MQNIYLIQTDNITINNSTDDVEYQNVRYKGSGNFNLIKCTWNANLLANQCEIEFIYSENLYSKDEIFNTFYNKNICVSSMRENGYNICITGVVYNIQTQTGSFTIQIQSNLYKLSQQMAHKYSQLCRASFCDENCGLSIAQYTHTDVVTSVDGQNVAISQQIPQRMWSDGACYIGGKIYKINNAMGQIITLFENPECSIGDAIKIIPLCNKTLKTCIAYNNVVNFQGEPFI